MATGDGDELVGTLQRRREVLEALDERPRHKPALAEELSIARSTVDRAIRELTTEGLAEREPDGYVLTTAGELTLDAFTSFTTELAAIREATDILPKVPSREYIDRAFLSDVDVVRATVSAPHRSVRAFVEQIERAEHARGFSPTAYDSYVDVFTDRIVEEGMTAELVFSDGALTEITANHPEALERTMETGRVDVHRLPELPELGLIVLDLEDGGEMAMLGIHEGKGLGAVLMNDSRPAVEWARSVVAEHFERAERIPF